MSFYTSTVHGSYKYLMDMSSHKVKGKFVLYLIFPVNIILEIIYKKK